MKKNTHTPNEKGKTRAVDAGNTASPPEFSSTFCLISIQTTDEDY